MESIRDIKATFEGITDGDYSAFIERYSSDERSGVKQLLKRAQSNTDKLEKEIQRTEQMLTYEKEYSSCSAICGIDEVGRGPLAGPVVAGAVILPKDDRILYLNDSKQLSAAKRDELYDIIHERAIAVSIGIVDHVRIDEINILQATYEAMRSAIMNLAVKPDILLNDECDPPRESRQRRTR